MKSDLINFENTPIRKAWHNEEYYFSIVDVITFLTESKDATNYWTMLKKRENELSTICGKFKFLAPDGKMRTTDCANTEGVFRILMSVPSPKVEPFKLWLARVGKERIDETENPELAMQRAIEDYKAKGYSEQWIANRMKTIDIRNQLTGEWKARGVKEGQEYSILTATIAKGTFGLTPKEHKDMKGLSKPTQNLRDHMTPLELILTALGEETTRLITVKDDAQGFEENIDAAIEGGSMAGEYRGKLESRTGKKAVSSQNYLNPSENDKTDGLDEDFKKKL